MSYGLAQARYASDTATTVSPGRLLTMLYDRLVADLTAAHEAMLHEDWATSGQRIANASEILLELHATLDVDAWPDGDGLSRLYLWMVSELMQARVRQSAQRVADCRDLVVPLRDAWRQAGEQLAAASAPPERHGTQAAAPFAAPSAAATAAGGGPVGRPAAHVAAPAGAA